MAIHYSETREFTPEELERLFRSVEWLSGNYPNRLQKAMRNAGCVLSAWDGSRLVGLIDVLDDGELTAYIHYLLVDPAYQGQGIGKTLVGMVKEKYKDYLYLLLLVEEQKNVSFYRQYGFIPDTATPMVIQNP